MEVVSIIFPYLVAFFVIIVICIPAVIIKMRTEEEIRNRPIKNKKTVYNPVTHRYYEIRQHSSKAGKNGEVKGLWK